ncbi:hypothetical protein [Parachryseolinea silvisoli]|jgi:hypothetical protein|uniref:hypothetical protein n=1 Tax=Parachryseolinea silvisoli TaxID=2873601 RepID=UPI002265CD37|nr:hypothetical protein [Parachryseolinea silvisoli]MCD9015352.1 hypothetical protein [Parachryseolinea silvisoli]
MKIKHLALNILLLLTLSGCPKLQPEKKNIVCLIDFSSSINRERVLAYADGIKMILSSMGPNDKLMVYPIDAGSLTDRVTIMFEDFQNADGEYGMTFKNLQIPDSVRPPFKKKGEDGITATATMPRRVKGYLKVISPLIENRLDSLRRVRRKYNRESDLLSAIYSVKDDFVKEQEESWMPGERTINYLVIFSDLVQESDMVNFNSKRMLEKSDYNAILQKLRTNNLLCNLQGAKILVYDGHSNVSQNAMAKIRIREFWECYFADTTVNAYAHSMKYQNSSSMDELLHVLRNY